MLPKIKYTKQRGGYYHLNIPIPASIRREYGGRLAYERTTGSSDPKEAERQVTAQRAAFGVREKAAQRRADQARLKALLDPAEVAAVESLGGPQHLSRAVGGLRTQMAFLIAGQGATEFANDEDLPPDVMRDIQIKAEAAAHQAFQETVIAEIRRLKSKLHQKAQ